MEFGILRRKAGEHVCPQGGGFPDLYVAALFIQAAQLKPSEKMLLMASTAGNVEFARASKRLRQLFQSPNAATKEDILRVTGEPAQSAPDDLSYEGRLAHRKAGKQRTEGKGAARPAAEAPWEKSRSKQVERRKNGFHRRTGERNCCYRCGSEYHLLPQCPV